MNKGLPWHIKLILLVQAKHQPLQFLKVSTLREYLRYEFLDLVGEALDPPAASNLAAANPWHQDESIPEAAPDGESSDAGSEGSQKAAGDAADSSDPGAGSENEDPNQPNAISAEPSIASMPRPAASHGVNRDGQFDFERVLQDFVLLTFLVSLGIPYLMAEVCLYAHFDCAHVLLAPACNAAGVRLQSVQFCGHQVCSAGSVKASFYCQQ